MAESRELANIDRGGINSALNSEPNERSVKVKFLSAILLIASVLTIRMCEVGALAATTNSFVNWETAPVHPVALSPDGRLLAVCNLRADTTNIYTASGSQTNLPIPALGSGGSGTAGDRSR